MEEARPGGVGTIEECFIDATGGRVVSVQRLQQEGYRIVTKSCATGHATSVVNTTQPGELVRTCGPVPLADVTSGSVLFDGLYAMAKDDLRLCEVECIRDGAFNEGIPLQVDPVYETGESWPYVWTRDTAYAAYLSLGAVDPQRAANSLLFKTSHLKPIAKSFIQSGEDANGNSHCNDVFIVQDTGTGGSYPVSSDRVTWALGAGEVLKYLDGEERKRFLDVAYPAICNTIEMDRSIVYDEEEGLYRGEMSFLDWREQTYPLWAKDDLAHIAGSKSLSTNLAHLHCILLASSLAQQREDTLLQEKYSAWGESLRRAITERFYVPLGNGKGMYAIYKGPQLHPALTQHYDLLGSALAVILLYDDLDENDEAEQRHRAEAIVATYPHAPYGPPVIHPQHPGVPIYHNAAIWPFVTALWIKAAMKVGNWKVVNHSVWSLMRAAGLHQSNMENLEFLSGETWVDAGPLSGPVLNSKRQLWSVAGYLSMVLDVIFGLQARDSKQGGSLRFRPFVTRWVRHSLLSASTEVKLSSFSYRGKQVQVRIILPAINENKRSAASVLFQEGHEGSVEWDLDLAPNEGGAYQAKLTVNGKVYPDDAWLDEALLLPFPHINEWTVELAPHAAGNIGAAIPTINLLGRDSASFAPLEPSIGSIKVENDLLKLELRNNSPEEVLFNVYRDGLLYAERVGQQWIDPDSGDYASTTHFYSAQAVGVKTGLISRHSASMCYTLDKEQVIEARDMRSNGGVYNEHQAGVPSFYCYWGDRDHWIAAEDIHPPASGTYAVQVLYSNGSGPHRTGIACGLKWLLVLRLFGERGHTLESKQLVVMPQNGAWDMWNWSTAVKVRLDRNCSYDFIICDDETSPDELPIQPQPGTVNKIMNMTFLDHFTRYYVNSDNILGGGDRTANFVNIARLRLLLLREGPVEQ